MQGPRRFVGSVVVRAAQLERRGVERVWHEAVAARESHDPAALEVAVAVILHRHAAPDALRLAVLIAITENGCARDRRHDGNGQAATRLPHAAQKLASGSRAVPHFPQNPAAVESCRPQAEQ
jgi:hypothetical protein